MDQVIFIYLLVYDKWYFILVKNVNIIFFRINWFILDFCTLMYTEWFYPEKSWTEQSDTQDLPKYFLSLSAKGQDELVLQPESHHEEHPASTAL